MWLVRESAGPNVPVRNELIERDLLRIAVSHRQTADRWPVVLEHFASELDWDHAELWLPRSSGRLALTAWWSPERTPAMTRFTEISRSIDFAVGEGLPGRVWRSGDIERLYDIADKPESVFRRSFIARSAGLRSWLAVPVCNSAGTTHVVLFAGHAPRAVDDRMAVLVSEGCHAVASVALADP